MRRDYLFHSFFLAVFLFLLYQGFRVLEPFLTPIMGAIVLAVLAYPLHHRFIRWFPKRSASFQAIISTIAVFTLIVLPFLFFWWLLFNESETIAPLLHEWTQTFRGLGQGASLLTVPWIHSLQQHLNVSLGIREVDFERVILLLAAEFFSWIRGAGEAVIKNAVLSLWQIFVMSFTLFFLFRDEDSLLSGLKRLIPMRSEHKERIAGKLRRTITEIVRGSVLTSVIQMLCATLGYFLARVPAAVTMGVVTGVASFIPVFGTALVWIPLGLFYLAKGAYFKAIFIFVWGGFVVSTLDNLLRTVLIGRRAELPLLFLFFGILGGAKVYGIKGLLLGPLLVAIIPVFLDIYRDHYLRQQLPEDSDADDLP